MGATRDISLSEFGPAGRVVVVAPHPDDEVFAVGGLMALLEAAGFELEVLAVTDGEASHSRSTRITPEQVRDVRDLESRRAYRELGIQPKRFRLRLPDSEVGLHLEALKEFIEPRLAGAALVLAPLETDGHPDHDAIGAAVGEVARIADAPMWQYAVWARLRPGIREGGRTVRLPAAILARKRRAVTRYASQFTAIGPDPFDGPVLPPGFVDHFTQSREPLWRVR